MYKKSQKDMQKVLVVIFMQNLGQFLLSFLYFPVFFSVRNNLGREKIITIFT